ncbi:MAG: septum formation initiator family protein [Clostridia bacterium]
MRKKTSTNIVVKFVFLCVLVFLVFSVINMQIELRKLKQSRIDLEDSVQRVTDTIEEVTIRINTPITPDYIERVAREKLGYRKPNEIIFYNDLAD